MMAQQFRLWVTHEKVVGVKPQHLQPATNGPLSKTLIPLCSMADPALWCLLPKASVILSATASTLGSP